MYDKTLNRLASDLSLEERHEFLEKLKGHSTISFEPLYDAADDNEKNESFEGLYPKLPWYTRLFYSIISAFKSLPPPKIFEENQINILGRRIQTEMPWLFNYQQRLLLPGFYDYVLELKEAARFFYNALDCSINQDKGSFYAFLGSLEMSDVHTILETNTTAKAILEIKSDAQESEMRSLALREMESAFSQITDTQRNVMYYNARSLNCLKELSAFLFDRLLLAFGRSNSGQTCPVNVVREILVNLNNILFSLKDPPPLPLLESLFIFQLQGKRGETGFNIDQEMKKLLASAEQAIVTIRNFNNKVPLTRLLRCAFRDISIAPRQVSGGEDWFSVYREHWKRHIESSLAEFINRHRFLELQQSFKFFLKGVNLKLLENAVSDNNQDGVPLPEAFTLAFLRTFHSSVFLSDINLALRTILTEGEFFKKENRTEFTGAYNDLMRIEDETRKIDLMISPDGEYGKRYAQAKNDMSSLPVKRKKIQLVLDEISRDAKEIIIRSTGAAMTMVNVLCGILKKEAGGKYDTLANLEKLKGKKKNALIGEIEESIIQLQQALKILKELETIDHAGNIQ